MAAKQPRQTTFHQLRIVTNTTAVGLIAAVAGFAFGLKGATPINAPAPSSSTVASGIQPGKAPVAVKGSHTVTHVVTSASGVSHTITSTVVNGKTVVTPAQTYSTSQDN
jgi:hypothetical protein